MKEQIKNIIGNMKCIVYNIKRHGKNIYICRNTKIIGGNKITFGNNVQLRPECFVCCNLDASLIISDNVDIGTRSRIISGKKIIFEKDVLTGPNVFISDQDHRYDIVGVPISKQGVVIKQGNGILIKEGAWIGTNSVIVGNLTIGKGSVIGANSVVTKDVPDYTVVAGVPAKIIKKYDKEKREWVRCR